MLSSWDSIRTGPSRSLPLGGILCDRGNDWLSASPASGTLSLLRLLSHIHRWHSDLMWWCILCLFYGQVLKVCCASKSCCGCLSVMEAFVAGYKTLYDLKHCGKAFVNVYIGFIFSVFFDCVGKCGEHYSEAATFFFFLLNVPSNIFFKWWSGKSIFLFCGLCVHPSLSICLSPLFSMDRRSIFHPYGSKAAPGPAACEGGCAGRDPCRSHSFCNVIALESSVCHKAEDSELWSGLISWGIMLSSSTSTVCSPPCCIQWGSQSCMPPFLDAHPAPAPTGPTLSVLSTLGGQKQSLRLYFKNFSVSFCACLDFGHFATPFVIPCFHLYKVKGEYAAENTVSQLIRYYYLD